MRRSRLGSPPITPKEEYPSTQLQDRKGCIMVLFNLGVHSGPDHCQEGTLIPPPPTGRWGGGGRGGYSFLEGPAVRHLYPARNTAPASPFYFGF